MQKWEYLWVIRSRSWGRKEKDFFPTDWVIRIITIDEKEKEWKGKLIELLAQLGDDGWELSTTWSRSDQLGGMQFITGSIDTPNFSNQTRGNIDGTTTDFAGFTTSEHWVFKRTKS